MSRDGLRRITATEAETVALGRVIGRHLVPGDLLALTGELGAGKTCLVRGIAAGLGCDPAAVRSPTFVLHHLYRSSDGAVLHHLDLYRLGEAADISVLDLEGLLETGVAAVEWAELADLDHLAPTRIRLESLDRQRRSLTLDSAAPQRLVDAFMSSQAST